MGSTRSNRRNNRNSSNGNSWLDSGVAMTLLPLLALAVPVIGIGLIFFCVPEPPKKSSSAAHEPATILRCNSRDSCLKMGHDLYSSGRYRDALRPLTMTCDFGERDGCFLAGLISYEGHVSASSFQEGAEMLVKACSYSHRDACRYLDLMISKHFKNDSAMLDKAITAWRHAYENGIQEAGALLEKHTGEKPKELQPEPDMGKFPDRKPPHYTGCGDRDFITCYREVTEAIADQKPVPQGTDEIKVYEVACNDYDIGRACLLYADMFFDEDDTNKANYRKLMGLKKLYLDKACHLMDDAEVCRKAVRFRDSNRYGPFSYDMDFARNLVPCRNISGATANKCMALAESFENDLKLSPRGRTWRAAKIYENLCDNGYSPGCQRLRKLNPDWWTEK